MMRKQTRKGSSGLHGPHLVFSIFEIIEDPWQIPVCPDILPHGTLWHPDPAWLPDCMEIERERC